jgi:hypothetical protein
MEEMIETVEPTLYLVETEGEGGWQSIRPDEPPMQLNEAAGLLHLLYGQTPRDARFRLIPA